jgi:hypothetical protein
MIGINPDCPPGIALLADHLDASLAAGEDLLALSLAARADLDEVDPQAAPEALEAFVQRLHQLEASLVLRLLQARRLTAEIARADADMRSAAALFRAQTDVLHEMISGSDRDADGRLTRAGDSHAYIRSRGLIAPEAAAPSPFETLAVDESFRVGGVMELGQVLDFVSSALDLLDARFGLFMPDLPDEPALDGEADNASKSGEAGSAPTDSLANVLGMVRATAVADVAKRTDATKAQVAPVSVKNAPPKPDETSGRTPGEAIGRRQAVNAAESQSATTDEGQGDPSEKSRSSRPVDYRSLAERIAEIQRSIDRS